MVSAAGADTAGSVDPSAGEARENASTIRPLTGVRIVDLSQVAAGPYGTSLLGDLGADVIKVEPLAGDSMRHVDETFGPGESAYFFGVNRSKRSIAIDLRSERGYEVLRALVESADVFVVAFRPSALQRMRIDYESIAAINPRILHVTITAFGETGPRASQPGMDILAQALSGMMGVTGERGGGPVKVGVPVSDFITSYLLGFAVCAGLRLRDQTGRGDKISLNLLDGAFSAFANFITAVDRGGLRLERQGGAHPQLVPYQPFLDADGQYFILACLNDKFWELLLPILDDYGDFRAERYRTNQGRVDHREELCAALQLIFAKQSSKFWLAKFELAGVPCSPIYELEDALQDPQAIANQSAVSLEHPLQGSYKVINNPIRFGEASSRPWGYAPILGEHSAEILGEAGFTSAEIEELINSRVVGAVDAESVQDGARD